MHNFFKALWLISIYGIIFFTFTSITFATASQFYKFQIDDEIVNSNIIMIIIYLIILFIISAYWCKQRQKQKQAELNIQMKPLYSNERQIMIE